MSWYYIEGILIQCGYVLMVVLGLSLLTGFAGLFSFGHAGFMAIGAYVSAICTTKFGLSFLPALLLGGVVAGIVGVGLGSLTLNLKGDYFCIATLGFGEAVRLILENWEYVGGARGISGIPWETNLKSVIIACVIGTLALMALVRSRHGRSIIAIREDELAAEMSGINTFRYKMIALIISAVYAGIGGGLLAHYMTYIQPKMFQMVKSTEYTIIVIFGGLGSVTGSIIGTFILTFLPEMLRSLDNWRLVIYGLAVIVIIVIRPRGLMGGVELGDIFRLPARRRAAKLAEERIKSMNGESAGEEAQR